MAKIPINIATGSLQQPEMIVGIDLGTTNSLIAIMHPETGHPIALKEHDRSSLVPSVIYFDEKGEAIVGDGMKLAGEAAEGVYSVWAASPQLSNVSSTLPAEILASPIESGPLGVGYDGVATLAAALKEKGETPRDKLQSFLGPTHSLNKEIALFKFQQGRMVLEEREDS